jgi:hypothetical protein
MTLISFYCLTIAQKIKSPTYSIPNLPILDKKGKMRKRASKLTALEMLSNKYQQKAELKENSIFEKWS